MSGRGREEEKKGGSGSGSGKNGSGWLIRELSMLIHFPPLSMDFFPKVDGCDIHSGTRQKTR